MSIRIVSTITVLLSNEHEIGAAADREKAAAPLREELAMIGRACNASAR
jgi:hypothetical protein